MESIIYNDEIIFPLKDISKLKNLLLIDFEVQDNIKFYENSNENTFPIIYSYNSSKEELKEILKKSVPTNLDRLCIITHNIDINNGKLFLDNKNLFTEEDLYSSNSNSSYSENMQFIIDLIKEYKIKNFDYLACDTLKYQIWKDYYDIIINQTKILIGASDDETGNIKFGGDWILESTGEDIEKIYFTSEIKNYSFTLASTINNPPTINIFSGSQTVNNGSEVNLTIDASGNGILSYQWYDGELDIPIDNAINTSYTYIAETSKLFYVIVTNTIDNTQTTTTSSTINILVNFVNIISEPISKVVYNNTEVTLSVDASGNGLLSYQWYDGESNILIADAILNTYSITANNNSSYYVAITNLLNGISNTINSNTITITINNPPTINSFSGSQSVNDGSEVNLTIEASGNGILSYQWYYGESNMLIQDAIYASYTYTAETSKSFYVIVTNTIDNTQTTTRSSTINISINNIVNIITEPIVTVTNLNNIQIRVNASGNGLLNYQWYDSNGIINGQILDTYSFQATSTNEYYVIVKNSLDGTINQVTSSTALIVCSNKILSSDINYGSLTILITYSLTINNTLNNGNYLGNILNLGSLIFNFPSEQTLGGIINSNGSITQQGSIVTLSGMNLIKSLITINSGKNLIITGLLDSNGNYSGNIVNNGTLTFDSLANHTLSGTISGSGLFVQQNNLLTISGSNTYKGSINTDVSGNLMLTGLLDTSGNFIGNIVNNGSLTFDSLANHTLNGTISGDGLLALKKKNLTISGSNTYKGSINTDVSGNLMLTGILDTSGNYIGNIVNNGSLSFDSSANHSLSGTISGAGLITLKKNIINISGTNTYKGSINTDVSGNILIRGLLDISGNYSGNIINNGSITFDSSANHTLSGIISGAGLFVQQNNLLTIGSSNTYKGSINTDVSGNILITGLLDTSGNYSGNIINNGSITFDSSANHSLSGIISGAGLIALKKNSLNVTGNNIFKGSINTDISGNIMITGLLDTSGNYIGNINNNGSLTFDSSGNHTLGGTISGAGVLALKKNMVNIIGTNTYKGSINTDVSGNIMITGLLDTSGNYIGNIDNKGTLTFNSLANHSLNGILSGSGLLVQQKSLLTLDSSNIYKGSINTGISGNILITGLLDTSGNYIGNINNNGSITFNSITNHTLTGIISGNGLLVQQKSSLNLNASNTFNGPISIDVSGNIIINGLLTSSGNYIGNIINNGSLTFDSSGNHTLSGIMNGTGILNQKKSTITISGNLNTFSGLININSTSNLILSGRLNTDGNYSGNISNNGSLFFNSSVTNKLNGIISGSGNLYQQKSTLTLEGSNTYTGLTTIDSPATLIMKGFINNSSKIISDGILDITSNTNSEISIKSLSGSGKVYLGLSPLNITNANNDTFSGIISGNGSLKITGGTETFSGNNTYSGTTNILNSTLILSNSNLGNTNSLLLIDSSGNLDLQNSNLTIGSLSMIGTIKNSVGNSSLIINGTSTVANSINVKSQNYKGLVTLGSNCSIISSTGCTFTSTLLGSNFDLLITGNATFNGIVSNLNTLNVTGITTLNSNITTISTQTYNNISINNPSICTTTNSKILITGNISGTNNYEMNTGSGMIEINGGVSLVSLKIATSTNLSNIIKGSISGATQLNLNNSILSLSGSSTNSGNTIIDSSSTLVLNGTSVNSKIESNGIFDISNNSNLNISINSLSGSGKVYLGSAQLIITNANNDTFSGEISGNGSLRINGGIVTLSGNNSYLGTTFILNSTLIVSNSNLGNSSSLITVNSNGILDIQNSNLTIGSLYMVGTNPIIKSSVGNSSLTVNGTSTLANNINLSTQFYTGAVALGANCSFNSSTGCTFNSTLSGNNFSLVITGNATFNGIVSNLNTLNVTGITTLNSNITTISTQTYNNISINNPSICTTTNSKILITGNISGTNNYEMNTGSGMIEINGGVSLVSLKIATSNNLLNIIKGTISGTTQLNLINSKLILSGSSTNSGNTFIDLPSTLILNGTSINSKIESNGIFDISNNSNLNISINSLSGSGKVYLGSAQLIITNANNDIFSGVISGNGSLKITGGTEIFSGINTYKGATYIANSTLILSNSNLGNNSSLLQIDSSGNLDLQNSNIVIATLNMIGSFPNIKNSIGNSSLTVNGNSTIGNSIYTNGSQYFSGAVTLSSNTVISGNDIIFNSTINGSYSLTINDNGNTNFNKNIGEINNLESISISSNTININSNIITTIGSQTYNKAVILSTSSILNGNNIIFNETINAKYNSVINSPSDAILTINDNGNTKFAKTIGFNNPLNNLVFTQSTGTVDLGGDVNISPSGLLCEAFYSGYFSDNINFFYNKIPNTTIKFTSNLNNFQIPDYSSYRISGYFYAKNTGNYYFKTNSDDSSIVYLDNSLTYTINNFINKIQTDSGNSGFTSNNLIVNNSGAHGSQDIISSAIYLTAGNYYPILIYYGQFNEGRNFSFYYKEPNEDFTNYDLTILPLIFNPNINLINDISISTNGNSILFNNNVNSLSIPTQLSINNTISSSTFIGTIGNNNPLSNLLITTNSFNASSIALTGYLSITNTENSLISGIYSGSSLNKYGTGLLELSNNNIYNNGTFLGSGILRVSSPNNYDSSQNLISGSLGTSSIYFLGGILQYSNLNTSDYSSQISSIGRNNIIIDTNGQHIEWQKSPILDNSDPTNLQIRGGGSFTLSNIENSYSGGTEITNNGTLKLGNTNVIPLNTYIKCYNSSTFDLMGFSQDLGTSYFDLGINSSIIDSIGTGYLNTNNYYHISGINSVISAVLKGTGYLNLGYIGQVNIYSQNTFSGDVIINQDQCIVTTFVSDIYESNTENLISSPLGIGKINFNGNNNGRLQYGGDNIQDYSNRIKSIGNQNILISTNNKNITWSKNPIINNINSITRLSVIDLGSFTLSSINNSYTGGTYSYSDCVFKLGNNNVIPPNTDFRCESFLSKLDLNGFTQDLGTGIFYINGNSSLIDSIGNGTLIASKYIIESYPSVISANLSGNGRMELGYIGQVTITSQNTFTGGIFIKGDQCMVTATVSDIYDSNTGNLISSPLGIGKINFNGNNNGYIRYDGMNNSDYSNRINKVGSQNILINTFGKNITWNYPLIDNVNNEKLFLTINDNNINPGSLSLSSNENTLSGGITILSSGKLKLETDNILTSDPKCNISINNSGTVDLNGYNLKVKNFNINDSSNLINSGINGKVLAQNYYIYTNNRISVSAILDGVGASLTMLGRDNGTIYLSAKNTYTGNTYIGRTVDLEYLIDLSQNFFKLKLDNDNVFPNTDIYVSGYTTLDINGSQNNFNKVTLRHGVQLIDNGNLKGYISANQYDFITVSSYFPENYYNWNIVSNVILTGNASLNISGSYFCSINANNTYTNGTNLNSGTVQVNSPNIYDELNENLISSNLGLGLINFNGGTLQYANNNITDYSNYISKTGNQSIIVDTNGYIVTWKSIISDNLGFKTRLTKNGNGILILDAYNTYSDLTIINDGSIGVTKEDTINAGSLGIGNIQFSNNGYLKYQNLNSSDYLFRTIGTLFNIDSNGLNIIYNNSLYTSVINIYINDSAPERGSFQFNGNNSFSGTVNIKNSCKLIAGNNSAFGTATIIINYDSKLYSSDSNISLNNDIIITDAWGYIISSSNNIFTLKKITVNGFVILNGIINFNGTVTGNDIYVNNSKLIIGENGTISNKLLMNDNSILSTNSNKVLNNLIVLNNGGNFTISTNYNLTINSVISNVGNLLIDGEGTVILSGTNTFTGDVYIKKGIITVNSNSSLGNSSGKIFFEGGTLKYGSAITNDLSSRFDNTSSTQFYNVDINGNNITWNSALLGLSSTLTINNSFPSTGYLQLNAENTYGGITNINGYLRLLGKIKNSSKINIISSIFDISTSVNSEIEINSLSGNGNVILGNKTLKLTNSNDNYSGIISGIGNISLLGGRQTLSGINIYSGTTTLSNGTLVIGISNSINSTSSLIITSNGIIDLYGNSISLTSLSGTGKIINSFNSNSQLTLTNSSQITFAGIIEDGTGKIAISKSNLGILYFTGNNTYSGGSSILQGTIKVGSNNALGSGLINMETSTVLDSFGFNLTNNIVLKGGFILKNSSNTLSTLSGDLNFNLDSTIGGNLTLTGIVNMNNNKLILDSNSNYILSNNLNQIKYLASNGFIKSLQLITNSDLIINGSISSNLETVSLTSNGNITINTGFIISSTVNKQIVLNANGNFINNSSSSAVSSTNWVIYSTNPTLNTFGGLNSGKKAVWEKTINTSPASNYTGKNYVFKDKGTLIITTTNNNSKTYGDPTVNISNNYIISGTTQSFTSNYLSNSIIPDCSSTALILSSSGTLQSSLVGSYLINASGLTENPGFTINYNNIGNLNINKKSLTINAVNDTKIYGNISTSTLGITYDSSGNTITTGLVGYSINGLITANNDTISQIQLSSIGSLSISSVASYSIIPFIYTSSANVTPGNYNIIINNATLTVTKRSLSVIANASLNNIYNGLIQSSTYSVSGNVNNDNIVVTGIVSKKNIGNYLSALNVTYPTNNYTLTINNSSFNILPAQLGITALVTYNGSTTFNINSSNYTLYGLVNDETLSISSLTTRFKNVSDTSNYILTITETIGNTISSNYIISQVNGVSNNITINPTTLNIKANNSSKFVTQVDSTVYNGATYTGFISPENTSVLSGSLNLTRSDITNNLPGSYILTSSGYGSENSTNGNYKITYSTGDFTIYQAKVLRVNISLTETIYGTYPTYTGTASYLDISGNIINNLTVSIDSLGHGTINDLNNDSNVSNITDNDITTFDIIPNAMNYISSSGNYKVNTSYPLKAINVKNNGSNANIDASGNITFSGENYNQFILTGTLKVNPYPITVTAQNQVFNYGSTYTLGTISFNHSPLITGDKPIIAVTLKYNNQTNISIPTPNANNKIATNYYIVPSNAISDDILNYNITYMNGLLTINSVPLTVTAINQSVNYGLGLNLSTLNPNFTSSGLVNNNVISSINLIQSGNNTNLVPVTQIVNKYTITPTSVIGITITNYDITYINAELTINRIPLTITPLPRSIVYGSFITLGTTNFSYVGLKNSDNILSVTLTQNGNTITSPTLNVNGSPYSDNINGIIASDASGNGLSNYNISYLNGIITMTPATLTYIANSKIITYGEIPSVNSGSVNGFVNNEIESNVISGTLLFSTTATSFSNIGNYAINGSGLTANFGNYIFIQRSSNSTALTIIARNFIISAVESLNNIYTGLSQISTYTISNIVNNDIITVNGLVSKINVGNYISNLQVTHSNNYNSPTINNANYNIIPAALGISASVTYNGTTFFNVSSSNYTLYGLVNNETLFISNLTAQYKNVYDVSNYVLNITYNSGTASLNNYKLNNNFNMSISNLGNKITINPTTLNIKANNSSKFVTQIDSPTYNGVTYTGFISPENTSVLSGSLILNRNDITNNLPGSYILTASGYGSENSTNGNYKITYSTGDFSIYQAKVLRVNIALTETIYGTYPTYTGTASYLDISGNIINNLTVSIDSLGHGTINDLNNDSNVSNITDNDITTFNIIPNAMNYISSSGNYKVNASYSLKAINVKNNGSNANIDASGNITFSGENYNQFILTGILKVNPYPISVTAQNQFFNYGSAYFLGTILFNHTPLITGDKPITAVTLKYNNQTNISIPTPNANNKTDTKYYIVPSNAISDDILNYNITYTNGFLTINSVPLTVTAINQSVNYGLGLNLSTLNPNFTSSGLVNNNIISSITLTQSGNNTNLVPASQIVNKYTITPTSTIGITITNYDITYINGELSINPISLTITPRNQSVIYGTLLNLGTIQFDSIGLLFSDSVSSVILKDINGNSTIPTTVPTGNNYKIFSSDASGNGLSNYILNYGFGTLTVNKRTITLTATITNFTYDGLEHNGNYIVNNIANNEIENSIVTVTNFAKGKNSGTYGSSLAGTIISTNYILGTINDLNNNLIISRANLGISATVIYNGTQTFNVGISNYTFIGLVNSETLFISNLSSNNKNIYDNSSYVTSITKLSGSALLSNYQLNAIYSNTTVINKITINAATLSVTANNSSKFVLKSDPIGFNGALYSGFQSTDSINDINGSLIITRNNSLVNSIGTYNGVLIPSGFGIEGEIKGNYSIHYINGNFTILAANTLKIIVNDTVYSTYGILPIYNSISAQYVNSDGSEVTIENINITNNNHVIINDQNGEITEFDIIPDI